MEDRPIKNKLEFDRKLTINEKEGQIFEICA